MERRFNHYHSRQHAADTDGGIAALLQIWTADSSVVTADSAVFTADGSIQVLSTGFRVQAVTSRFYRNQFY